MQIERSQLSRQEMFLNGLAGLAELKRVYDSKPVPAVLKIDLSKLTFEEFYSLCELWLTDEESIQYLTKLKSYHTVLEKANSKTSKAVTDTAKIRIFAYTKYFRKRLHEKFLEDNQ
jgi:hypothetical protein